MQVFRAHRLILIAGIGFSLITPAVYGKSPCMRLVPDAAFAGQPEAGEELPWPDHDGPGAFGPLHNTLTLGCLRYVAHEVGTQGSENAASTYGDSEDESVTTLDASHAVLLDERNECYRLRVGDYVGERHGRIDSIDAQRLVIVQVRQTPEGDWVKSRHVLAYQPSSETVSCSVD